MYVQELKEDKVVKKMFLLRSGRIVSVTSSLRVQAASLTAAQLEVSVKEPQEDSFHAPIQTAHPKYCKLKTLDEDRQRILQLKYSGLNKKEIDLALEGLRQLN